MRFLVFLTTLFALSPLTSADPEHVILCGGPALRQWEDLRVEDQQHDRWWANFIRASTLRMADIRLKYGKEAKLVWIVFRPGYVTRAREDGKPLTKWIQMQATKRNCELVWVSSGPQAMKALNARKKRSIITFDYFGHSNRHAFMLDYGNDIMAISTAWIHENDLHQIEKKIFAKDAICQSYGCHTGESMSRIWRKVLDVPLIGAAGKTNYEVVGQGKLPSVNGSWVR